MIDASLDEPGARRADAFAMLTVRPSYVVAYDSTDDPNEPYEPLVVGESASAGATWPHGLSHEMASGLSAASYCLRLPRTFADFFDLKPSTIDRLLKRQRGHNIILAPTSYLASLPPYYFASGPLALVIAGDGEFDAAEEFATARGARLPTRRFSELSIEQLADDWSQIAHALGAPNFALDRLSGSVEDDAALPALLGTQRLARQMGVDAEMPESPEDLVSYSMGLNLHLRASIRAMASMEAAYQSGDDAGPELLVRFQEEWRRIRVTSLVIGQLGTSPKYAKISRPDAGARELAEGTGGPDSATKATEESDADIERRTIELMVAHRAVAHDSLGIILPDASPAAYDALWRLEDHWSSSRGPTGPKVRRALDLINKHSQGFLAGELSSLVNRSNRVRAYTNFPIGLTSLPGETAPMSMRVPVSQMPLAPLTRMLTNELLARRDTALSPQYRVLIAECIPPSDRVGQISRRTWPEMVDRLAQDHPDPSFSYEETLSPGELHGAIDRTRPDILVLSAHGFRPPGSNMAGVMIGDTLSLGLGIDNVPPIVLLSACSVAPRGAGDISIVDLLLREGARAILGAAVPINVYRNALLLTRMFLYLSLALAGDEPETTLLDVWHRVHCGNAINDIITGCEPLNAWALRGGSDYEPPLVEFMNASRDFNVRQAHVYKDTEDALVSIAARRREDRLVRAWLQVPGYVPESAMYTFYGEPENVHLSR